MADKQGTPNSEDSGGVKPAQAGAAGSSREGAIAGASAESGDVANEMSAAEQLGIVTPAGGAEGGAAGGGAEDSGATDQAAIDELLRQAAFDDPAAVAESALAPVAVAAPEADDFKLPNFNQVMQDAQISSIDLLKDVELNVKIELGRSRMLVEDVLKLGEGSVVELDKLAGDPVDVFVNDRLVARGEVLVLNDNFCVRVNEILAGAKEEF